MTTNARALDQGEVPGGERQAAQAGSEFTSSLLPAKRVARTKPGPTSSAGLSKQVE